MVAKSGPRLPPPNNEDDKSNGRMRMWPGQLIGQGLPMPLLASNLSNVVDRVVLDKTGLPGLYDITLKWAPEQSQLAGLPSEIKDTLPHPDLNGPSIFTAVQEQLGLKLQPSKGPVEVLVIDHVERPSKN